MNATYFVPALGPDEVSEDEAVRADAALVLVKRAGHGYRGFYVATRTGEYHVPAQVGGSYLHRATAAGFRAACQDALSWGSLTVPRLPTGARRLAAGETA